MLPDEPYRDVPILLVDVEGFASKYPDIAGKRAVLRRLQDALTQAARLFVPEGDVWSEWLRHDVGDGYYVVSATLTPQQELMYVRAVGENLTMSGRLGASCDVPNLRLRMVLALGNVERVEDQLLSDAFITARPFIDDPSFSQYAREMPEPTALILTERFHHELKGDLEENSRFPRLGDLHFTPVEVRDKHGHVHRGEVLGTRGGPGSS